MKLVFYASHKPREVLLARALADGAKAHGDDFELRYTSEYGETIEGEDARYSGPTEDTDVVCVFGAKGKSRRIMSDHKLVGRKSLYFDKGFTRSKGEAGHTEYSRIIINGSDPSPYMMGLHTSPVRFDRLGIKLAKRHTNGGHILFCGSSQKYCDFNGLGDAGDYASGVLSQLRKQTPRQIVYRPKPSDRRAGPVGGFAFSPSAQRMDDALRGCYLVVTHGATAAMDAVLAGVPAITLGGCIATPVSGREIRDLDALYWPESNARLRWAHAMAYCQWTTAELRDGSAWAYLKPLVQSLPCV